MNAKRRDLIELKSELERRRSEGLRIAFTNGCFDLLHPGHVRYLQRVRNLADLLVVGINSDESVRRLKGSHRPILAEDERAEVLAALACVDYVTIFSEDTPLRTIEILLPDVLAKGGDWPVDQIVGRETVEKAGGKVVSVQFEEGYSTSDIINRIRRRDD